MVNINLNEFFYLQCFVPPPLAPKLIEALKEEQVHYKLKQVGDMYRFRILVTPEDATKGYTILNKYASI